METELMKIKIDDLGGSPICLHNYPCPIYQDQKAVRIMGSNYFQPSWKAQKEGYKIVKAENFIQRFLLRFFKTDFDIKVRY
jgi:hypothetical protein